VSQSFVLAVHGGAGPMEPGQVRHPGRSRYDEALCRALRAGQAILMRGGTALRAVTEAVRILEDDDLFNAGRGAVLCADGSVELSASVMDGRTMRVGAMVGLRRIKNPVLAARALLRHPHGMLFGEQADAWAEAAGVETVRSRYFRTPARIRQWERSHQSKSVPHERGAGEASHGTVGAVALDRRGNLAAATSTGGLVNQLPGRVGDTPIIGAGTWADRTCAISTTGRGDAFVRMTFARRVADLVEIGRKRPGTAALRALDELTRVNGRGGCIVIGRDGRLAMPFNAPQMPRGWVVGRSAPVTAIGKDDEAAVG